MPEAIVLAAEESMWKHLWWEFASKLVLVLEYTNAKEVEKLKK